MTALKRERERKKAERAAQKREQRHRRAPPEEGAAERVAGREELESYGMVFERDDHARER